MLNKVRPTIKKYAKTPMRCRYIEKRMKLFWNAYIDEVFPRKFKYDLRWAMPIKLSVLLRSWRIIRTSIQGLSYILLALLMVYWGKLRENLFLS